MSERKFLRFPKGRRISELPLANVELITSEQIVSRGYADIIDLLSDIPGFEISKTYSVIYSQIYQVGLRKTTPRGRY